MTKSAVTPQSVPATTNETLIYTTRQALRAYMTGLEDRVKTCRASKYCPASERRTNRVIADEDEHILTGLRILLAMTPPDSNEVA
jgi:hypothetical protein